MNTLTKHFFRLGIILLLLGIFAHQTLAQFGGEGPGGGGSFTITGPTSALLNQSKTYTISGSGISSVNWIVSKGIITSSNNSSATVTWNQTGTGNIYAFVTNTSGQTDPVNGVFVSITNPAPSAPPPAALSGLNQCGYTTLSHLGQPSGVTWYWQGTNASGTSTSYPTTYSATTNGTYYLRARNNSDGQWSSSSTAISVTIDVVPSTPGTISVSQNCGNTVLTRPNPPSGTTFYWQSSASGTSTSNSSTTVNRSSAGTYYLRARNNASGCWSSARSVSHGFNAVPSTPPTPTVTNNCGNTVLTRANPPSGHTYYWQSSSTGTSTSNSASTVTRTSGSVYYLRSRNNSTGCWSSARSVSYGINNVPLTPPTPAVTNNCGNTVLSRANPPSGTTYYWQSSSSGTSTSNSASTVTRTSGTVYYLRARNNSTGCWSSIRSVSYSINALPPTPTTPMITNNCGNTVLTRGTPISGFTYYWQSSFTGTSTSNSSASITMTSGSTYYLRARDNASGCWGTSRTVNYSINNVPGTPPEPIISNNCGNTELIRSNPPSGITYYWQSAETGTSTSNSAASVMLSSGNTYYLRARNNSSGCWGSARTISYGIDPIPAIPPTPTVTLNCNNTVLTRANPPSGYTYYWQSSSTGTSTSNSASTVNQSSAGTYYLRSRSNTTGCWSTARSVSYGFNAKPAIPPTPTVTLNCDNTVLTRATPPSGFTYYWQSASTGTSTSNSASTVNRSSAGTYYLRARNNTTGCWSDSRSVSHGFNALPATPPTVSVSNNCGNSVLTRQTPPSGFTYYWQSAATGTSISSSASSVTRTSGSTYFLRSRNNTTGCWSPALTVNYSMLALPATPPVPTVSEDCGVTVLTRATPTSGFTYYWQSSSTGTDTSNSFSSINLFSAGTYYVRSRNNSTLCWGPAASVSYGFKELPSTPPAPTVAENCGVTVLTRANPPSGFTYYWQSTAFGTDDSNANSSINLSSGTSYHLRARNNTTLCWSLPTTVNYTVKAMPTIPPSPTVTNNCGNTVLTRANPATGFTYYWQTTSGGTSTGNSAVSVTLTSGNTYYLRAQNDATGCWGPVATINYGVNAVPSTPPIPTISNNCGNTVLTRSNPASGYTYYWQSTASGTSTASSDVSVTMNSGSVHYLRSRNNTTLCWGPATTINYTVNPVPAAPPVPTVTENCGNTVLTRANPPAGFTYYWQSTATGTNTSSTAAAVNRSSAGTYHLRAQNDATGCWSTASTVSYGFNAIPATPAVPVVTQYFGSTVLTRSNPPSGVTWYWQGTNSNGVTTTNTSQDYTITTAGTYYLRGQSNAGCWGNDISSTVTVEALPQIAVTGGTQLNGIGDMSLLSSVGTYASYTWKRDGVVVGTGSTFEAREAGSYTLVVTKAGISSTGESAPEVITGCTNLDLGDENYVMSTTVLVDNITSVNQLDVLTSDKRSISVSYADGLGRPIQTVGIEATRNKRHLVQPVTYDEFGRQDKSYLPYAVTGNCAVFQSNPMGATEADYTTSPQYQFYQNEPKVAHDAAPYAVSVFEKSPLNRVLKQGAPGAAWQPVAGSTTDRVMSYSHEVNVLSEVRHYTTGGGFPVPGNQGGYYPAGELTKVVTRDEDYNRVIEFTNKLGQVVLKRVETGDVQNPWADTYYVYDAYNNLRLVLPPEANKEIAAGNLDNVPAGYTLVTEDLTVTSTNYSGGSYMYVQGVTVTIEPGVTLDPGAEVIPYGMTSTFRDQWAFQYQYDHRQRMVAKRVPGVEDWTYMVYDHLDRLVLTQDAKQRDISQWTFTKYDEHNRPVLTGFYTDSRELAIIRAAVEAHPTLSESIGGGVHGYTNNAFPPVSTADGYLTVTYYDHYNDLPAEFTFIYTQALGNGSKNNAVKGQVVGTKTKVVGGTTWLKSVMYYDDKYRVLQTVADNHLGGNDRITNKYDFAGRLLETQTTHDDGNTSTTDITVKDNREYDHAGRLLQVTHKVDNDTTPVLLVKNEYNALGELVDKDLHSVDGGCNFEQYVDTRYNIRGWLERINDADLSDGEKDYFGMQLAYNNGLSGVGNSGQFNGNISGVKWSSFHHGTGFESAYAYSYDQMNRLTGADYLEKTTGWTNTGKYDVDNLMYDLNGNIKRLTRFAVNTGTAMDDITYGYAGNRLMAVTDAGNTTEGFKDGNTTGDDYAYDKNGNMISDANKGITSISYNHLNLPRVVTFTGGRSITYTYDAAGMKLAKSTDDNGAVSVTDYTGGFIYEDGVLQQLAHAEGRVRRKASGDMVYDYYLKDHLGNTRITFTTEDEEVIYLATMETEHQAFEDSLFLDIGNTREMNGTFNYTLDTTITADEAVRLRGNDPNRQLGPGKLLQVSRGDSVDLEVFARYTGNYTDNDSINSAGLLSGLITAVTGAAPLGVESSAIQGAVNDNHLLIFAGNQSNVNNSQPRAYLNYILFDSNFTFVNAGFKQVSSAAKDHHERVFFPKLGIDRGGYLYVYLSNESNNAFDVYFDDLRITHTKGRVLQEDHYYPFGLNIQTLSSTAPLSRPNQFKFSGNEEQVDFDWNVYDFNARTYDPILGRFVQVDPLVSERNWVNPYNYVQNNPLLRVDPEGTLDWVRNEEGEIYWDDNANSQLTTKEGETYLGKELTFTFNSDIRGGDLWDGPGRNIPVGDKLTSTITLKASENSEGQLTGIKTSGKVVVGETPVGTARSYFPGLGGDQNKFSVSQSKGADGTLASFSLNFEQHASVPKIEEYGLAALGYGIVNVAQKLDISSSGTNLSISAATDVFPSANLSVNNVQLFDYVQPSFKATHGRSKTVMGDDGRGGSYITTRTNNPTPPRFYTRYKK